MPEVTWLKVVDPGFEHGSVWLLLTDLIMAGVRQPDSSKKIAPVKKEKEKQKIEFGQHKHDKFLNIKTYLRDRVYIENFSCFLFPPS